MREFEQPGCNESAATAQDAIDLVNELKAWCINASPSPLEDAALIFALSSVGGIAARQYNIGGSGLAQYYWFMARSGAGKGTIKKCRTKLFASVSRQVPSINDFKGMGYCGSGQALLKFLARKPNPVCITDIDEFAHDVMEMSNPKNENAKVKQKVHLELWSLGGAGDVFEPMIYSDSEKNIQAIASPNQTLVGNSTIKLGMAALTGKLSSSGYLARTNVIIYPGPIPEYNEGWEWHLDNPPQPLVDGFACLAKRVLELARDGKVCNIEVAPDAAQHFAEYAKRLRVRRNSMSDDASDILNRNLEKAKKTAGTLAVGLNHEEPRVTLWQAKWATDFIDKHANRLVKILDNDEAGEEAGNESKQRAHILKTIANYFGHEMDWGNPDRVLRLNGIIKQSYFQSMLSRYPAFKDDRRGATAAIKAMLYSMSENGELQAAEAESMSTLLQKKSKARAYYLSEPNMIAPYWPADSNFCSVWEFCGTINP